MANSDSPSSPTLPETLSVDSDQLSKTADGTDDSTQSSELKDDLLNALPRFLPRHRRFLHYVTMAMLVVLCVEWIVIATRRPSRFSINRGEKFKTLFVIDINSANWVEWSQLEGIGPGLASRITAYRKVHGPFQSIEDLLKVPGIGPSKLDAMRSQLTIRYEKSELKYVDKQFENSPSGTSAKTKQPSAVQ
jgi:competence ComEA-like helix-hairpin-helix protein